MAKSKKGTGNRVAKYVKAGPKRMPKLKSYRDSDGKRHWMPA
jgi:hypothetical protein